MNDDENLFNVGLTMIWDLLTVVGLAATIAATTLYAWGYFI